MFFYRTRTEDIKITWEHIYNKRGFSFYRFYFRNLGTWHFSHMKLVENKLGVKRKFYVTTEAETGTLTVEVSQGSESNFYFVLKDCFGYTHKKISISVPKKTKDGTCGDIELREAS